MGHDVATSKAHDPSISAVYPAGPDTIIDADSTTSTGDGLPGAQDVSLNDNLTSFESTVSGNRTKDILMIDVDSDNKWSTGDALVLETVPLTVFTIPQQIP